MSGQASSPREGLSGSIGECSMQAWKLYKSLSSAPESLRDLQDGTLSLMGAWRLVHEFSLKYRVSIVDGRTIASHMARSSSVLAALGDSLENLRNGTGEVEDVAKFAQKLVVQAARISSFYEILKRPTQERILTLLEEMQEMKSEDFQQSLVRNWSFVLEELQKFDLSEEVIKEEFFFIDNWLKEKYSENSYIQRGDPASNGANIPIQDIASASSSSAPRLGLLLAPDEEEEELPGYTPGKKPTTVAEKAQILDKNTALLNSENLSHQLASTSASSPPAYTFDASSNQEIDKEFTQYIKAAIGNELKRRVYERNLHPERGPHPYTWLPKSMQIQYAGRSELLTMLDENSFTVMGYETTPWCLDEIELLLPVLRLSADGTGDDSTIIAGLRTLKIMSTAMHKYIKLQDPRASSELFSDLDVLSYEASTAISLDTRTVYPEQDFELAQKSYYMLLTYVMGMVSLMKSIFPGRQYVTRSREDLEHLWRDKKMDARTAWIEKQLAGWDQVEQAVQKCRDWHRLRPSLRDQAVTALQQWRQAQELLASSDTKDEVELTVISATGVPKSRMGFPNISVKLVLYGSNGPKPGAATRKLEVFTESSKNTQFPIWNQKIPFTCPNFPKMLDLEIYDRGMRDKEISRVRLNFTHIPGVERNFAGRSLMFGLDEEISLPFKLTEGKGKEVEQPLLRIRLKWDGRFSLLEKSGLIMSAPGKMFRPDLTGIPMPFAREAPPLIRDEMGRRSDSTNSGLAVAEAVVDVASSTLSALGNA